MLLQHSTLYILRRVLYIQLHATTTAQFGPVYNICVCVCVCVFIKLHITAQSGPVILPSHSMPLASILPRKDQWYLLRKPLIRCDRGDTLSLLVQILLEPWAPCAPPPASLLLSRLSGLAAIEPTLSFLHFFSFHPCLPRFPHGVYNYFALSCASLPPFRPPRS